MVKIRSFADKMSKRADTIECPVCKSTVQPVLVMEPRNDNPKGSWKFRERFVRVCKCNHKEIYG